MKTKKILAVIRVSTETQETESQKKELVDFILSLGKFQEEEIEFIEVCGASAVKMNDKYLQMLQSIKDKITESDTIRSVAFWHLNRLGRNEKAIVDMKTWFIDNRIQVYVKNPSLTLLDDMGNVDNGANIAWGVFAAMVAYDTKEIKEKTMRGRKRSVEDGKVQSGNAMFGYAKDKNGYIIIDEEGGTADTIRNIFQMYLDGKSTLYIYETLSKRGKLEVKKDDFIGKRCINNILSNVSYCGRVRNGKKVSEGKNQGKEYGKTTTKYPAIISEEIFDKVAAIRKSRQHEKIETGNVYFGKSIIRYIDGDKTDKLFPTLSTATYWSARIGCSISINVIDSILWEESKKAKLVAMNTQSEEHKTQLERYLKDVAMKIDTSEKIIIDYEKKIERINDLYIDGAITKDKFNQKRSELSRRMEDEKNYLHQYKEQRVSLVRQLESIGKGGTNCTMADVECIAQTDNEKYEIIHEMIGKVIITKEGDKKIISLINPKDCQFTNTYIYERKGSRVFLSVNDGKETKIINPKDFIVRRFERQVKKVS